MRNLLRGVEVVHQSMTIEARKQAIIKRAGRDPIELDKRPAHVIMNDSPPYRKWERQQAVINRAGYRTWAELLQARHNAEKNERS